MRAYGRKSVRLAANYALGGAHGQQKEKAHAVCRADDSRQLRLFSLYDHRRHFCRAGRRHGCARRGQSGLAVCDGAQRHHHAHGRRRRDGLGRAHRPRGHCRRKSGVHALACRHADGRDHYDAHRHVSHVSDRNAARRKRDLSSARVRLPVLVFAFRGAVGADDVHEQLLPQRRFARARKRGLHDRDGHQHLPRLAVCVPAAKRTHGRGHCDRHLADVRYADRIDALHPAPRPAAGGPVLFFGQARAQAAFARYAGGHRAVCRPGGDTVYELRPAWPPWRHGRERLFDHLLRGVVFRGHLHRRLERPAAAARPELWCEGRAGAPVVFSRGRAH